jgi:hypothetical protein
MQRILQQVDEWFKTFNGIWKRPTHFSDFVWLARFRALFLCPLAKIFLLVAAGEITVRLRSLLQSLLKHARLLFTYEIVSTADYS